MSQDEKKDGLEYIQLSHRPRKNSSSGSGQASHRASQGSGRGDQRGAQRTAQPHHTPHSGYVYGESRREYQEGSYGESHSARRETPHWEAEKRRRAEAAEIRKKKKRRMQLTIVISLVVLIAVLIFCVVWKLLHKEKAEVSGTPAETAGSANGTLEKLSDADFQYPVSADKQELGTAQEMKEIADYEGYALRYPAIGNGTIDGEIAKRAGDIVSIFKGEVQALRGSEPVRMTMLADYEIYQTGESLVSVKFNVHKELPTGASDTVETYTYKLEDGAQVALSDVLKEGYLDLLSTKTKEFAAAQGGTVQEAAAAPADLNFQHYTWNEDGLTLYFAGGALVPEKTETIFFTIPMEELSEYLTMDLLGTGQSAAAQVGKVDPAKPMVCLTFDDGPKAATTPELLDILEENDARATFFLIGDSLKGSQAEEIVKRELALGCQVGNHTLDHQNFKDISDEEIHAEIEGVNDILEGWGLPRCSTVRPPYGGWNNHVISVITEYPLARWNVDTEDWKTRDPEATINKVLYDEKTKAADGDIILMHDIHAETIEACKTIIPELKARGFQLVTMEEMFAAKGIPYEGGQVYYSSGDIRTDFGS